MTFGIERGIPNAAPYKANVSAKRPDRMVGESQPFGDPESAVAWVDGWVRAKIADGFEIVRAEIYDSRNDSLLAGTAELAPPRED